MSSIITSTNLPIDSVGQTSEFNKTWVPEKISQVLRGTYLTKSLEAKKEDFAKSTNDTASEEIKHSITNNYKKHSDGTLEMVNQEHLKRQKQVLGFLVKEFGSAFFSGKSIMSISLPVTIFEPRSNLERQANSLSYAPYFLEKAGALNDSLEQFKLVVTQFIASLHLGLNPQKPFNPILGETFQGILADCPIYIEQIAHHPPVSFIQMLGKSFTLEAKVESTAAMSINSVKSRKEGLFSVTFNNTKATIHVQYPSVVMGGTAMGKRTFQFSDKFIVFDLENKYYAEIVFDCENDKDLKKTTKLSKIPKDYFAGSIWMVKDQFMEKVKQNMKKLHEVDLKFNEKEHSVIKMEVLHGSWLEFLKMGNSTVWSMGSPWPYKLRFFESPLPSDSNFRLDVLYLRANDETKAQEHKKIMEELQRNDRKLREAEKLKK